MRTRFDRLRDFHANLHPLLRAGLWLAVLGAIAAVTMRPAYREFKVWRAGGHLRNARAALDAGRPAEAREYTFSALALAPQDFKAIPLLAESMRALKDPRAADIARILLGHPQATDADKLTGFKIMAEQAPLATVGAAWHFLGEERQNQPEFRVAFVRRLVEQTQFQEAAMLLQASGERGKIPDLDAEWLRLVVMSQDGRAWYEAQELGRKILRDLPDRGDDVLECWEKLPAAAVQEETAKAARAWCDARGDRANINSRLAAAWLETAVLADGQRDGKIQQTISAFATAHPAELAHWLVRHGMPDRALGLAVPAAQADSPAWFQAKAAALRGLKRWKELLAHLEKAPNSLPPLELTCDRMFAAAMDGNTARRNLEWKQAGDLAHADSSRNAYLILAEAAVEAGMREQAEDAMVEALRLGTGRLPLHSRLGPLIQSLAERGRGRDLLDVFARLASLEPGNPMVLANYSYWGIIHGLADTAFVIERMGALRQAMPSAVPVRVVLGLAWLSKGDAAKACEATEIAGFDWSTAAPTYRAARGSALLMTGKPAEAEKLLSGIDWDKMLPRETNFFHSLLKRFSEGKSPVPWLAGLKRRPETDGGNAPMDDAQVTP